jgi:hypothetical protein
MAVKWYLKMQVECLIIFKIAQAYLLISPKVFKFLGYLRGF